MTQSCVVLLITAFMVNHVVVVVSLRVAMTTSLDSRGRPRQLRLIAENSRCSILFHLEVPGGRWQTVMSSPASAAKAASSVFHNRSRDPLDPPESAVISSLSDPG